MDSDIGVRTAPELARRLGVSLPRAHRLLDAAGADPSQGRGHARLVDPDVEQRLVRKVGAVPQRAAGLSRIDMLVLAAVSRAGLGLDSTRAVARAAGVSPTAAGKSLRLLEDRELVGRRRRRVVQGKPRDISIWVVDPTQAKWTPEITEAIARVELPAFNEADDASPTNQWRRVPSRFAHLFWNVEMHSIHPLQHSDFVASRMLTSGDPDAWAWAVANLPRASVLKAAGLRGVSPRRKALIHNLVAPGGT